MISRPRTFICIFSNKDSTDVNNAPSGDEDKPALFKRRPLRRFIRVRLPRLAPKVNCYWVTTKDGGNFKSGLYIKY